MMNQKNDIGEMTAKELKNAYIKADKRIKYAVKRIGHEEEKEFDYVPVKVRGSSPEFPYLPSGTIVEGEDPEGVKQSRAVIQRWKQEIKLQEERKQEIETLIDKIEDTERRDIWWAYCIEDKKQQEIAQEMYMSQRTISIKLKKI